MKKATVRVMPVAGYPEALWLQWDAEVNPDHVLVKRLKEETDESRFADWSFILFDQAMLSEGGQLDDPVTFVKRMNDVFMTMSSS